MNYKRLIALGFCLKLACSISAAAPPSDYVQIHNGRFELHGKPFVVRGINYFGSWLFPRTIAGDGVEHSTIWTLYHDWDHQKASQDFAFIRTQLRATAVRIGTPARDEFDNLIVYHKWDPWYQPDGSISEGYKKDLVELADAAYANHVRIQFCLIWNLGNEMAKAPDDFAPGGAMDRFYANQVHSIGLALRDHPGVMAFSIGNEVLVNWPINGMHTSAFEGRAAAFKRRRLHELRSIAPFQLLTDDECSSPGCRLWHDPGPEFAMVSDPAEGQDAHPFRIADEIDYLGPHFYPEELMPQDLPGDAFAPKIANAQQKLADYMKVASATGKPVVLDEFGLSPKPASLDPAAYAIHRDEFYRAFIGACEKDGVQGVLSWGALPTFVLRPGDYTVTPSKINPWSPLEVDIQSSARRILFCAPSWDLFVWDAKGDEPLATPSAKALAAVWPKVPLP